MSGLFWRLFAVFCAGFVAIDIVHSIVASFIGEFEGDAQSGRLAATLTTYGAALPIALALSGLLSWYLSQPIRVMRRAFSAMSAGRLDTRVRPLLRSRRDDIADLGRDFDGMAHRLEGLLAVRQRMLQDASHELRSPLARLQTAIGLAQQNPDNILQTLDRIESESLRLQAMLESMLMLAQMEAGTGFIVEDVDCMELLSGVACDAQFEAQARGCDVLLRASGPCVAPAQPELLHRAFENVIRNAVKYTAAGTAVEVLATHTRGQLRVTVADRGPGVAATELARIFEPFHRAGQATPARVPGFGLGLAIARRAIEHHGGSIAAENRAGGGLVVAMTLPIGGDVSHARNDHC